MDIVDEQHCRNVAARERGGECRNRGGHRHVGEPLLCEGFERPDFDARAREARYDHRKELCGICTFDAEPDHPVARGAKLGVPAAEQPGLPIACRSIDDDQAAVAACTDFSSQARALLERHPEDGRRRVVVNGS